MTYFLFPSNNLLAPCSSLWPYVVFNALNAGSVHNLDLNLGISIPSSGDGTKDNESSGRFQFHPYDVHDVRRSNVIVQTILSIFPFQAIVILSHADIVVVLALHF